MKRNKAPNSSNSVFYTYYHLRHDFGLRKQLGTEVYDSSLLWIDKSTEEIKRKKKHRPGAGELVKCKPSCP